MRADHICTALCRQHLSPHTCSSQRCYPYYSVSKAPLSESLNETSGHSLQFILFKYSSRKAVIKLLPHFGLQWMASRLHSVWSKHRWEEWIPSWICNAGRLGYLSPHCLQPNTLALMGELVRGNQGKCIMNELVFWAEIKVWRSRTSQVEDMGVTMDRQRERYSEEAEHSMTQRNV